MLTPFRYLFLLSFLTGINTISSCNNDITLCESSTSTLIGIGFYQMNFNPPFDTILPAVTIFGLGKIDSLFAKSSETNVHLPLNQNSDTTSFYIQPDTTGLADTIQIIYTRTIHLISPACGFVTFYNIDSINTTHHNIDSIYLETKTINNTNVENIQLFY